MHRRRARTGAGPGNRQPTEVAALIDRIEAAERRLERLETTLESLAMRTGGTSIGGPCSRCGRGLLLVSSGTIECPACGYKRHL